MLLRSSESFAAASPRCIQSGELVVIYERFDMIKAARVNVKNSHTNKWGTYPMKVS